MEEHYISECRVVNIGHHGKCIFRAMEICDLRLCGVALLKGIVLWIGYLVVMELLQLR